MPHADLPNIGTVETAQVDGLSIRYARSGAPNGTPILFTAPWPESIYAFHRILPRLGERHRLIAVDLPGFGLSQSRANVMAPRAMGEFVVGLLKHFGLERAHVFAPDVGELAVLFAASGYPDLFESIAVGGAATRADLAAGALKQLMESPPGALAGIDGADGVKDYLTQAAELTPAAIIEDFKASSRGRRLEDATQFVRAYLTELAKLEPLLPRIKTPVFVIAGKNDAIVPPENNKVLADALPRNRYTLLDGGHRIWEEAAGELASQLVSWFGGGYRELGA